MDGGRLREWTKKIGTRLAVGVGSHPANAVRYPHHHGVVHLDSKPENIYFKQTCPDYWDVPNVSNPKEEKISANKCTSPTVGWYRLLRPTTYTLPMAITTV